MVNREVQELEDRFVDCGLSRSGAFRLANAGVHFYRPGVGFSSLDMLGDPKFSSWLPVMSKLDEVKFDGSVLQWLFNIGQWGSIGLFLEKTTEYVFLFCHSENDHRPFDYESNDTKYWIDNCIRIHDDPEDMDMVAYADANMVEVKNKLDLRGVPACDRVTKIADFIRSIKL